MGGRLAAIGEIKTVHLPNLGYDSLEVFHYCCREYFEEGVRRYRFVETFHPAFADHEFSPKLRRKIKNKTESFLVNGRPRDEKALIRPPNEIAWEGCNSSGVAEKYKALCRDMQQRGDESLQ